MNRKQRIRIYGSPSFLYEPSISANAIYAIDFPSNEREGKYKPFDEIVVSNDSSSDIKIKINGSDNNSFIVEAGTSRVKDDQHFSSLVIKELSGSAIAEGELRLEISRQPMNADKLAKIRASKSTIARVLHHFIGV